MLQNGPCTRRDSDDAERSSNINTLHSTPRLVLTLLLLLQFALIVVRVKYSRVIRSVHVVLSPPIPLFPLRPLIRRAPLRMTPLPRVLGGPNGVRGLGRRRQPSTGLLLLGVALLLLLLARAPTPAAAIAAGGPAVVLAAQAGPLPCNTTAKLTKVQFTRTHKRGGDRRGRRSHGQARSTLGAAATIRKRGSLTDSTCVCVDCFRSTPVGRMWSVWCRLRALRRSSV